MVSGADKQDGNQFQLKTTLSEDEQKEEKKAGLDESPELPDHTKQDLPLGFSTT